MYPLSCGGLCDAVTMTPAETPRWRIANASTGVGSGRGSTDAVKPGARHDSGGVAGEHVGLVPRVVPDDDRRAAGRAQVRSEAGGGADDDSAVHPVRAGTKRAAQVPPCRTEAAR